MENLHTVTGHRCGEGSASVRGCAALAFVLLVVALAAPAAETSTNEPATVKVSGFGLLGNREMVRLLRNFQVNKKMPAVIGRDFVEDAAMTLLARANDDGYLRATLRASFRLPDGSRREFAWTNALEVMLPADFAAREAQFKVRKGVRFYYRTVRFEGLNALSEREARSCFVSGDALLKLHVNRVFSPAGLAGSLSVLKEMYARAGYQNAQITVAELERNESTGAVNVQINVREGLPTIVRSVDVRVHPEGEAPAEHLETLKPGKPYSHSWQQTLARKLQSEQFIQGHPDATVTFAALRRETNATNIQLDLTANVVPGPLVYLHEVIFRGEERTKLSVIESRVKLKEGDVLNRVAAEESRQRLARLGVFNSVRLQYEKTNVDERNVVYTLHEAKPVSLSVLAGYGSYELLRGGLEFENRNVLGLAHTFRARGVQSFKSSRGDFLYTIPEVFGDNLNLFGQGSALFREEISFDREEYDGSLGFQKRLVPIKTDFSLQYDYQLLRTFNLAAANTNVVGTTDARAASFIVDLTCDRRDNPMLPRHGFKLSERTELAASVLGGNVNYQRITVGAAYHLDLHGGRLLHLGVTEGLTFTLGGNKEELPFNKRFFPGGENTVRGYQEGMACPLDQNGDQLGAETYTLGNVEFEQFITRHWSVVAFSDNVGFAKDRVDYPWNEGLYSVGGGLRWYTLVGPVRLEYGYNLNRRDHDPAGTLHFSVGVPF
jgi:outer membrane protein insertion porin family